MYGAYGWSFVSGVFFILLLYLAAAWSGFQLGKRGEVFGLHFDESEKIQSSGLYFQSVSGGVSGVVCGANSGLERADRE